MQNLTIIFSGRGWFAISLDPNPCNYKSIIFQCTDVGLACVILIFVNSKVFSNIFTIWIQNLGIDPICFEWENTSFCPNYHNILITKRSYLYSWINWLRSAGDVNSKHSLCLAIINDQQEYLLLDRFVAKHIWIDTFLSRIIQNISFADRIFVCNLDWICLTMPFIWIVLGRQIFNPGY